MTPRPGALWRAARRFGPRRIVEYGLHRAGELRDGLVPGPLLALQRTASVGGDVQALPLRAWPRPAASAPPFRPELHGDPRRGEYRFLGRTSCFDGPPDWEPEDRSALWRHRLNALGTWAALLAAEPSAENAGAFAEVVRDHTSRTRPGRGVGWHPHVTARRLLHLARTLAILEQAGLRRPELAEPLGHALRLAFLHLAPRVETHNAANHLLTELCAVAVGATLTEREGLARRTLRRVEAECGRQFGPDGGHFERSPRYHLDLLADLSDLAGVLGSTGPAGLRETVRRGLRWSTQVAHPDGDVPLFGDSELSAGTAERLASGLGIEPEEPAPLGCWDGLATARAGGSFLVARCGASGADVQPAHAHCDLLSFELSVDGVRVVSNRGTAAYGRGLRRRLARGTAAHNTVQVGEHEQHELFGGFRAGRLLEASLRHCEERDGGASIAARLVWDRSVGAVHDRRWELGRDGGLRVEDRVGFGSAAHPLVSRLTLPGARVRSAQPGALVVETPGPALRLEVRGASLRAEPSSWFPRIGEERPALRVEITPAEPGGPARSARWTTTLRRA